MTIPIDDPLSALPETAVRVLEAAQRNGELNGWRQDRALPERVLPEPMDKAA